MLTEDEALAALRDGLSNGRRRFTSSCRLVRIRLHELIRLYSKAVPLSILFVEYRYVLLASLVGSWILFEGEVEAVLSTALLYLSLNNRHGNML